MVAPSNAAGTIITTASMSGHIISNTPQPVGHYCASKAAVIQLTKAMAVEFAPHNIRVNSVSPEATSLPNSCPSPTPSTTRWWVTLKIPLGRLGRRRRNSSLHIPVSRQRRVELIMTPVPTSSSTAATPVGKPFQP